MYIYFWSLIFCFIFNISIQSDIKGFDDTVLFSLNWSEELIPDDDETAQEFITVTSSHQEKYKCAIPLIVEKETDQEVKYTGPSALELLSPLFTQSICSFKLESYWTYEVSSTFCLILIILAFLKVFHNFILYVLSYNSIVG